MKTTIFISLLFVYSIVFSQEESLSFSIGRSNIGMGGSTKIISSNNTTYYINQSIGQSSVIGTSSNEEYTLRQGYQQTSNYVVKIQGLEDSLLNASIYPNPFQQSIFISFYESISNDIQVTLFDISGSLIFSRKYPPSQLIRLNVNDISNGSYIINVSSSKKKISAKLIKR